MSACDVEGLQHILTDREAMKYSACGTFKSNDIRDFVAAEIETFTNSSFGYWPMISKSNGEVVGICGFNRHQIEQQNFVHINYRLATSYLKQGYATEVVLGLMKYARETLRLTTLYAVITPDNIKSIRVVERCNFKLFKRATFKDMQVNIYQVVT
jgi:ribosomal-protein-alanine N-acetyltransferase